MKKMEREKVSVKKALISIGILLLILIAAYAYASATYRPFGVRAAEPTSETTTATMTAEEMQSAILGLQTSVSELANILQSLVLRLGNNISSSAPATTPPPAVAGNTSPRSERPPRPVNPPISQERAIEIAFAHATAYVGEEGRLDGASLDWEKSQWVWEVEIDFSNRRELEVYIDINTGEVLWVEWD
ncbi:MAG: PepSY domain-containing protein [Defluviitaleaceae bacterium]|nr:PepSY domain-containing protein [Defluviitaleaceae bacterium]